MKEKRKGRIRGEKEVGIKKNCLPLLVYHPATEEFKFKTRQEIRVEI